MGLLHTTAKSQLQISGVKLWFVVEIGVSNTDLNNPNKPHSGVCYAHSKKGVFAAAK